MFSSLAKYLFGGFGGDETPETSPIQYATREVNDWLLVDMPDQDIDNEDLNSEGEEDDEILTALPLLMTQESYICDNSYDDIEMPLEQSSSLDTQIATQSSLLNEGLENFQILPESLYLNQSLYYRPTLVYRGHNDFHSTTMRGKGPMPVRLSYFVEISPNTRLVVPLNPSEDASLGNGNCQKALNYKPFDFNDLESIRALLQSRDKRLNHPAAYSKKFINHRSPVLSPKTALLEQIKELKPIQRAAEYDAKKYLTRSQLNRQNRNYIYECSVKTNRRRHLQRNHSGANNNRKC